MSRILRLTLVAPDIIEAILTGRQPVTLQLDDLLKPPSRSVGTADRDTVWFQVETLSVVNNKRFQLFRALVQLELLLQVDVGVRPSNVMECLLCFGPVVSTGRCNTLS